MTGCSGWKLWINTSPIKFILPALPETWTICWNAFSFDLKSKSFSRLSIFSIPTVLIFGKLCPFETNWVPIIISTLFETILSIISPNFFLIERAPYFLCGNAGVWFLTHLCGFCGLLETDRFSPDFRPSPAGGKSLFSVKYLQVGISSWKMDGF